METVTLDPANPRRCMNSSGLSMTADVARQRGYAVVMSDAEVLKAAGVQSSASAASTKLQATAGPIKPRTTAELFKAAGLPYGITKAAPAAAEALAASQREIDARVTHKHTVRAFGVAVRQLPEAACRPAAAARLASMTTFDPVAVMADDFDFKPQLDRVGSKLRGLPVETPEAAAPGAAAPTYCRTRRRVECKMAVLPQTAEGHRLRHKLSRVLMAVDEGRNINSALSAAGFDPAAYA